MSTVETIAIGMVLGGAAIFISGIIAILVTVQRKPYNAELAPTKGSPVKGIAWAFTSGMAPWSKESARIHRIAYVRGVIFQLPFS